MKKNLLYSLLAVVTVTISTFPSLAQSGGLAFPVITEIMYNPPESGADSLEFIEIYNPNLTNPLDVSGYYFSSGVEYTFPAGSVIPADGFVVVSVDSVAFENTFSMSALEWTAGGLSNSGEGIALRTSDDFVADTVFYDDNSDWADADQTGYSLVLCDPTSDNNLPANWTLSENAIGLTINNLALYADPGAAATCTTVGIADDNVITTIVYPNPTAGVFTIRFADLKQTATIDIHNTLGQVVYSQTLSQGLNSTTINADLTAGLYILTLTVGENVKQTRLVVE